MLGFVLVLAGLVALWEGYKLAVGQGVITTDPGPAAYRTDLAEAAVAELEEDGLDTQGSGFQKTQVILIEGGN